jgi:hypothetical protein
LLDAGEGFGDILQPDAHATHPVQNT